MTIINGVDLDDGVGHDPNPIEFPKMVKGRIAHIDADIVAYQCSCEKKNEPKSFDEMKYNAEILIATIKKLAGASRIKLHLTSHKGDKGGRFDTAILKEYQANRKDRTNTPPMLHQMRDWMKKELRATMHENCEADDGISAAQYSCIRRDRKNLSIICTLDKDLAMVPGLHLDWRTGSITKVKDFGKIWLEEKTSKKDIKTKSLKGYGTKWFWAQMLMGDVVDNISGIPKVWNGIKFVSCGAVKAYELLNPCTNDAEAKQLIKEVYSEYDMMDEAIHYLHWKTGIGMTSTEVFESEAKLLWMRRRRGDPDDVLKWMRKIR